MQLMYQKLHTSQCFATAIDLFYNTADHAQDDSQTVKHLKGFFQFLYNIDLEKDASELSQYKGALSVLKNILNLFINLHK
jgi:hypothetical protein